jgi:hypothetical protein
MSALAEDESLATLVADLDDSFWDQTLTPDNSPRKPIKSFALSTPDKAPSRHISPVDDDVDATHSNILSKSTLLDFHSRFKPLDHTRCTVESIDDLYFKGRYQKACIISMLSRSLF